MQRDSALSSGTGMQGANAHTHPHQGPGVPTPCDGEKRSGNCGQKNAWDEILIETDYRKMHFLCETH